MRLSLGKLASVILLGGALISTSQALELTVNNKTSADASFAFSYLDREQGTWMVEGWYNVKAGQSQQIYLNTDNPLYYLYAELSNDRKIEAAPNQGARLAVFDGTFIYDQDKLKDNEPDKKVGFVRAESNNNLAVINLN